MQVDGPQKKNGSLLATFITRVIARRAVFLAINF